MDWEDFFCPFGIFLFTVDRGEKYIYGSKLLDEIWVVFLSKFEEYICRHQTSSQTKIKIRRPHILELKCGGGNSPV